MRTTLDLDENLLIAARRRAAERGQSLTSVIEEALAAYLNPVPAPKARYRFRWKVHGRPGDKPLIPFDPADREKLYEFFDQEDGKQDLYRAPKDT